MKKVLLLFVFFVAVVLLSPHVQIAPLQDFAYQVEDTVAVKLHPPSAPVQTLAAQAQMTDKARKIFFAAQPVIDTDRKVFEKHCSAPVSQNTVELGCYTSDNHIYLLKIDNPQLANQMAVTASHEMLHAAYQQLSQSKRDQIDQALEEELPKLQNTSLSRELRGYNQTEPGQRDNELHSIVGTEYADLDPVLEEYYSQYFTDRSLVVTYAQQFDQTFTKLETALSNLETQIRTERRQMTRLLREGNVPAYNQLVPQVNELIQAYNADVDQYNQLSRSLRGEEQPTNNQ
jgi:hypothetical protein